MRQVLFALVFIPLLSCGQSKKVDYLITISTPHGDMKAVLYDDTPEHKANFLALAEAGRYDSTIFHRVIQDFMIQGGDVEMKEGAGAISEQVPYENKPHLVHRKGALAAARQGDQVNPKRQSSGCQFYIVDGTEFATEEELGMLVAGNTLGQAVQVAMQNPAMETFQQEYQRLYMAGDREGLYDLLWQYRDQLAETAGVKIPEPTAAQVEAYVGSAGAPHLDEGYSVFGQVVAGLEVIDKIAAVETGPADRPTTDVPMTVTVEKVKRKKLAQEYGEDYTRGNATP